jgi:UDP-N-acetylmuramoylalanine--D-glutamate ligase
LNYENEYTRAFGEKCPAKAVYFSSARELENGLFLKDDYICMAENGKATELLNIHRDMNLVGICNVENVMAAVAIGMGMDVPMDKILKAVKAFKAVEHRIEYVTGKGHPRVTH